MDTTQINFKLFNLIIFPDWNQSEESLYLDLEQIIKAILTNPDKDNIALLIDTSNLSAESELDPNLILSGITLDLLFQEDLDTDSEPEIIILENLAQKDWQNILPQIQYRIKLTAENEDAIADSGFANIPTLEIEEVSKTQSLKLEPSLLLNLANQSYQQGRYEEAVSRYQRLLESQTGEAEVYFSLSECWRNLKKI
ncbi:hypothetical protein [Phormidium nigroviride]